MSAPDRDPWPESVGHGAGQSEPVANGHRWPCPGFYTGNHDPLRVGLWACICTESPSPAPKADPTAGERTVNHGTVDEFNAACPVGTAVLAFPGSREGRALMTRTRSTAWLVGSEPVVMVEGYAGGIALTHVEVITATPDAGDASERRARTVARCPSTDLHDSHIWTPEPSVIHNAALCPGIGKVIDGRSLGLIPDAGTGASEPLREAVEALADAMEKGRWPTRPRGGVVDDLRALLAAHPEADPTAGGCPNGRAWCNGPRTAGCCDPCAAAPDAGDASEAQRVIAITDRIYADAASTGASEPLSEAERLLGEWQRGEIPVDVVLSWLAAREAKARAEGRREGYNTARGDMVSGAFIGGPTYEALRDSATGQRLVKEARAEAGEQIAQAIEALSGNHVRIDRAARIAREVTRPATPGPVDWDSPTWGGGTHTAAWAPDGTHDDDTEEE